MTHRTLLRRPRRPQLFSALSYLGAPLASMGRETKAVVGNPRAFFGGIAGAALICAALSAAFTTRPAAAQDTGPEVNFEPGVLTPLGVVYPEDVQVITADLHTVAETQPEQVTKDPTPPEQVEEPKEPEKVPPKPPRPDPPEDSTPDETNSNSNNPYPEPPTVPQNEGDPFGDRDGWGDLMRDGDPWATSVMKALNAMAIPAWAAKVSDGKYAFRLKVCRDGRIDKVYTKLASGDPTLDAAVKKELLRTRLPKMPASLAAKMPGNCATLQYQFTWSSARVR